MDTDPRASAAPLVLDVVIPAYNEELRLPETLSALREALAALAVPSRVTVVDNASTDGTARLAASAPVGPVPVRLLRCVQQGKGYAVRTGVLESSATYVGFCDADLATAPDTLPRVLNLLAHDADVVIGSRAHPQSVVEERHHALRHWGAAAFRAAVRPLVPSVTDTQCGYKFFRREVARQAFSPLQCGGFAFDVEVLARAAHAGARLVELPVNWTDVPGSRFSATRHGWRSFVDVAAMHWRMPDPVTSYPLAVGTPSSVETAAATGGA